MTETDLRWQLRQLPRDIEPAHDLWRNIGPQLGNGGQRRRYPGLMTVALAASLTLAVGLGWRLTHVRSADPSTDSTAQLLSQEAGAMTREYEAAYRQLEIAPVPAPLAPGLASLDRSARQLRSALASDPGSVQLFQQLRKVYARRLALTQRAVTS